MPLAPLELAQFGYTCTLVVQLLQTVLLGQQQQWGLCHPMIFGIDSVESVESVSITKVNTHWLG